MEKRGKKVVDHHLLGPVTVSVDAQQSPLSVVPHIRRQSEISVVSFKNVNFS